MKTLLAVCLGVLVFSSSEAFSLADRVGEPNERCFFLFSTSAGNYAIRQDGMGEFTSPAGMRHVFNLKLGAKGRIDRVYFLEHQGDLFLLYGVHDATSEWAYLVRMEQTKRKARWSTALSLVDVPAPIIDGDLVIIKNTEISKADGKIIKQD